MQLRFGMLGYYPIHEVQELAAATTTVVAHRYRPGMDFQGGKQGGGPVALVLMVMPAHRLPVGEAQPPLSALQGLDGGLLVHADHHGILRGVQVQPHDVSGLLCELGVGAHAPAALPLQVNPVLLQDPPHMKRRNVSQRLCHQPACPRRVPIRRRLVQLGQYSPHSGLVVLGRLARPGRVGQSRHTVFGKSGAPPAHGRGAHLQQGGDLLRHLSRCRLQNYAGPLHHALLRGRPAHPGLQSDPFVVSQLNRCRYSHVESLSPNAVY